MIHKTDIETKMYLLLNHSKNESLTSHKTPFITSKDIFSIKLQNSIRNEFYKAYARFPEIKLKKPDSINNTTKKVINEDVLSLLMNEISLFIKSQRIKRLFETYIFLDKAEFPQGLYHYYIKNHSFEALPVLSKFNYNVFFHNSSIIRPKNFIIITLLVSHLPQNNREWWYRENLIESGRLSQIIIKKAKDYNIEAESVTFYDEKLHNFLNINSFNEQVIICITL